MLLSIEEKENDKKNDSFCSFNNFAAGIYSNRKLVCSNRWQGITCLCCPYGFHGRLVHHSSCNHRIPSSRQVSEKKALSNKWEEYFSPSFFILNKFHYLLLLKSVYLLFLFFHLKYILLFYSLLNFVLFF